MLAEIRDEFTYQATSGSTRAAMALEKAIDTLERAEQALRLIRDKAVRTEIVVLAERALAALGGQEEKEVS